MPVYECVSYYCERQGVSEAGVYLALNLPRFGDGRQVTSSHHHGPGNTTHDSDLYVCIYVLVRAVVRAVVYVFVLT